MRLNANTIAFWMAVFFTLLILALAGCSHTTEITTNEIDTLTVIRPEHTETVPIKPLVPGARMVVKPIPPDTVRAVEQKEPHIFKGETKKHKVVVDLDAQTAEVTDKADTSNYPYVSKNVTVQQDESHWYDGALYIVYGVSVLLIVGGAFYLFVIRGRLL